MPPKLHFLEHYVHNITRTGPPRGCWSFPHERKNKDLKLFMAKNQCFKDICWTIGVRHQLTNSKKRQSGKVFTCQFGKICGKAVEELVENIPQMQNRDSYESVEIFGKKIHPGTVLIIGYQEDTPSIGMIKQVFKINDETAGFFCKILKMEYYDEHMCAALVKISNDNQFVLSTEIPLLSPLLVAKTNDDNIFVSSKYNDF